MDIYKHLVCFLLVLPCITGAQDATGEVYWESKVIRDKILNNKNYVKEARPSTDPNKPVTVAIRPNFLRVENINEDAITFDSTIIMLQLWTDMRLAWNESDYGGVKGVLLPADHLWLPEIIPYNAAEEHKSLYEENAFVSSKGKVEWGPMITVSAKCPLDMSNFPFDTQTCKVVFGSWQHSTKQMIMKFFGTDKTKIQIPVSTDLNIVQHPNWDIVGNKIDAELMILSYGVSNFSVLTVEATCKRKMNFHQILSIGPGALIGLLVPVIFLLPARSNEKNIFAALMLMGLILLIILIEGSVNLSFSAVPKIGVFYLATMCMVTISIVFSVITSNLSVRGARRRALPQWAHRIFLSRNGLRRILCIDKYSPVDNLFSDDFQVDDKPGAMSRDDLDEPVGREMESVGKMEHQLRHIIRCLRYICGKMSAGDSYQNVNQDWEEVARIIDRILFVVFFIIYAITALALLSA